jgi:tetratricopeptide (TPR) repeat protein
MGTHQKEGSIMSRKGGTRYAGAVLMVMAIMLLAVNPVWSESSLAVKKALFQRAEQVLGESDTAKTRFYAPKTFGDAMDLFNEAEKDYAHERSMKDINGKLDESVALFKKAARTAEEAARLFRDTDLARLDAHKVMASRYKPNEWSKAENAFDRAISKFERGDRDDAKELALEARELYRNVEKDTITYSYMAEIWETLKKMERLKKEGEPYAPKTYTRAMELAEQAKLELERQSYGNERAKELIRQALDEAEYGLKLSQCIKTLMDEGKTMEDLFLDDVIPKESIEKINHRS